MLLYEATAMEISSTQLLPYHVDYFGIIQQFVNYVTPKSDIKGVLEKSAVVFIDYLGMGKVSHMLVLPLITHCHAFQSSTVRIATLKSSAVYTHVLGESNLNIGLYTQITFFKQQLESKGQPTYGKDYVMQFLKKLVFLTLNKMFKIIYLKYLKV